MSKVYMALYYTEDGPEPVAIFSTREKAEAFINTPRPNPTGARMETLEVEEWNLDPEGDDAPGVWSVSQIWWPERMEYEWDWHRNLKQTDYAGRLGKRTQEEALADIQATVPA